jgi:hypothetical protein
MQRAGTFVAGLALGFFLTLSMVVTMMVAPWATVPSPRPPVADRAVLTVQLSTDYLARNVNQRLNQQFDLQGIGITDLSIAFAEPRTVEGVFTYTISAPFGIRIPVRAAMGIAISVNQQGRVVIDAVRLSVGTLATTVPDNLMQAVAGGVLDATNAVIEQALEGFNLRLGTLEVRGDTVLLTLVERQGSGRHGSAAQPSATLAVAIARGDGFLRPSFGAGSASSSSWTGNKDWHARLRTLFHRQPGRG